MKKRLIHIMEKEEIEILRKAKYIINLLYNGDVEFEDNVKHDLVSELDGIEELCIENVIKSEKFDEMCQDFDDEYLTPVAMCECCGALIFENDTQLVAADGSICCCDECVVGYNRENFPEDDDEEDE